jgi:hypothetical protein
MTTPKCRCKIITRMSPLTPSSRIEQCPLCKAAPGLLAALKPVLQEVKDGEGGEVLFATDRPTWNPDAHIEITLSAREIWAIQDAIAAAEARS